MTRRERRAVGKLRKALRFSAVALGSLCLAVACGGDPAGGVAGAGGGGAGGGTGGAGGSAPEAVCGVGPVAVLWGACEGPEPGCPATPDGEYLPLIELRDCSFGSSESGCLPELTGNCLSHNSYKGGASARNPDDLSAGWAGDIVVSVDPIPDGGFLVSWSAEEWDPESETPIGEPMQGEIELPDVCCQVVFDIHFPIGDFTHRLLVQTDWEALP